MRNSATYNKLQQLIIVFENCVLLKVDDIMIHYVLSVGTVAKEKKRIELIILFNKDLT